MSADRSARDTASPSASGSGPLARAWRAGARAFAAALVLLALGAGAAQAQSPVKLVGNTGQTVSGDHTVGKPSGRYELWALAQVFTTGPNAGGYTLSSVDVRVGAASSGVSPRVSIHSAPFGGGGVRLHELTNPASIRANAVNTFTAASGATLDANTTYAVVLETRRAGARYTVKGTASGAQDSGAAGGWSIADTHRQNDRLSYTVGWALADQALMVAVNGSPGTRPPTPPPPPPVSSAVTVSNLAQTGGSTASFSFDVASSFTTGSESSGYLLTRLDLHMNNVVGTPGYSVSIWTDSSGFPGSSVGTLTKPASLSAGLNSFTAPGSGIKLNPGTKYWVVFDAQTASTTSRSITNSSAEDSGAAAGWSIGDSSRFRGTSQSTWGATASTLHLRFAVHAKVAPFVVSNAPFTVTAGPQDVYIHLTKDIRTGSTGSHPMSGDRCPASQAFTLKVNGAAYGSWATRGVTGGPTGGNGLEGWRAKCSARMIHLELWNGPGFYLIPPGSTVTLSYDPNKVWTGPERGRIIYTDNTVVPAFTDKAVENNTRYVWWSSVNGTDLLVNFAIELNTSSVPAPSAFTVMVNGARRNVVAGGVGFFGLYNTGVKLVLESPVESGDTVTLAYDAPTQNPLRGARSGPVVPDFERGVRNDTPLPPGVVWEATLTLRSVSGLVGCIDGFGGSRECSNSLTENSFTWRDTTYRIVAVFAGQDSNGDLVLTIQLSEAIRQEWTLHVGDRSFLVANATSSNNAKSATWSNPGLTWGAGQQVPLRLTESGSPGGASGNAGPSPRSSSVSGTQLKMTFDATLSQGLAPPGGSFKVTVGPGSGARGNGGARGMGGAGANGGGFGTGAQTTSGTRTVDIPGTGTVTVDGADVTVTLARPVPPGSTVTVGYTPPDEDENALRDLEGAKVEEFSGEPVAHGAQAANRAPVVDEESSNYAGFVASGNAPRGVLVTKGFHGMFSDPDGDALTYTVALSDPGQAALVETLHVPTAAELAETPRRIEVARRVFFRADAEADWGAMEPAVPDPVAIAVTETATDPEGLSASVEGVFLTHWAAPRVESVAVVSNAGNDDTYALGDTIRVAVTFDERVTVDTSGGTPRLAIDMDPADWGAKWASYKSGSGTTELVFVHEVVEPNYSAQGIAVLADSLERNGGTIRLDTSYAPAPWMDADLAHAGLGHDPKHKVDWELAPAPEPAPPSAAPEATGVAVVSDAGPDDTYGMGDVIRVAVTFDADVAVTGTPGISIDMDPAPWGEKRAAYESGSGTATLTFAHTVVEPNYSTQGIAVLADTLALEGGAIRSASGADVALAHAGLGHDASHKVDWRPELSVADAEANEGADAAVDFEVSLSRAYTNAAHSVTVDYATADGTATAGEDYTATSGTLTFAPGETEKTVRVPVLDDVIDEGEETFTLRLSNAQGARIGDGEATGTIKNSDPLQKMWLSRFGRTVADHVTGAVADRLSGPLTGAQVTVGGQTVELAEVGDEERLGETLTAIARALGAPSDPGQAQGSGPGQAGAAPGSGSGASPWPGTGLGLRDSATLDGTTTREIAGRELLLGSAFHLAKEGDGGRPGLAAWGRVTVGGFDGEAPADDGNVRIDGNVTTGILGADAEWGRMLAGVAVSVSEGEGTFDQPGVDTGTIESTMTTVSPYARVSLSERVSVWGLAGYGTGDMTIVQKANEATGQPERITRTDLSMRLAALGGRGALLRADANDGFELALKADGFFVETTSEAISNEGDTSADASRVRLALEGSRGFEMGGGVLTPGLELGLRHDGGDAETGTGVEFGGRVSYTDPETGLSMDLNVRGLVAHEDSNYREWGASGAVRLAPGERGRGLSFSLAPTYGAPGSGVDRLWSARDARGLAPNGAGDFEPESRLEGELGYGLPLLGDRFTGTPNLGFGLSGAGARDYRIGWRFTSVIRGDPGFEVTLDATRREPANDNGAAAPIEHGVMLRSAIRW